MPDPLVPEEAAGLTARKRHNVFRPRLTLIQTWPAVPLFAVGCPASTGTPQRVRFPGAAPRCVLWEADDTVFEQVHRDNFVRGMLFGRQEANGDNLRWRPSGISSEITAGMGR